MGRPSVTIDPVVSGSMVTEGLLAENGYGKPSATFQEPVIFFSRTVYTLIIRRLESTDAGIYRCQLDLKGENVNPYKDGDLIVLGKNYLE